MRRRWRELGVFLLLAAVAPNVAERPWAVVTGASGGLGACLARDCSKRGYNVLLAARRGDRLEELAAELRAEGEEHKAVCVCCDLARGEGVDALKKASDVLDVKLAVLNAGLCRQSASFASQDQSAVDATIDLNVVSQSHMLGHYAARMASKGGGQILVIGSSAGASPGVPGVAAYGASKAYLRSLCDAVGAEQRRLRTGVSVTIALPSAIDTEFQQASGLATARVFTLPGVRKIPGGIVMSAEAVSRAVLKAALRGRPEVVPGFLPRTFVGLADRRLLPKPLARAIAAFAFST